VHSISISSDIDYGMLPHRPATISRRAFSLIELVIVVVIIGIVAAIAIPRLSRGSQGAADAALAGDLAVLRKAIDVYTAEHGSPPLLTQINACLTLYSDAAGNAQSNKDSTHFYGPYIRTIPPLPVGRNKGGASFAAMTGNAVSTPSIGWLYDQTTGTVKANTFDTSPTEADATGKLYSSY
jgi:prepilin-type N-terminal cleavage/methylation domain-containing protein